VEFVYNNKVQTSTKVLLFRANNKQDLYMGFEMRKKGKFEKVEKFTMRIKEVHEEAEIACKSLQTSLTQFPTD